MSIGHTEVGKSFTRYWNLRMIDFKMLFLSKTSVIAHSYRGFELLRKCAGCGFTDNIKQDYGVFQYYLTWVYYVSEDKRRMIDTLWLQWTWGPGREYGSTLYSVKEPSPMVQVKEHGEY